VEQRIDRRKKQQQQQKKDKGTISGIFTTNEEEDKYEWIPILSDGDWDTLFLWTRKGAAESVCRLEWNVNETRLVEPGIYRIRYKGRHKILNYVGDHEGESSEFQVIKL
jgi:hypothetical protein